VNRLAVHPGRFRVYDRISVAPECIPVSADPTPPKRDFGRDRPHRGADRRDDLSERELDVLAQAERERIDKLQQHYRLLDQCPEPFRDWLREVIDRHIEGSELAARDRHAGRPSSYGEWESWQASSFLGAVGHLGFLRAVMANVAGDDADAKDRRRGGGNHLPDRSVVWPLLCHVLSAEQPIGEDRWDWFRRTAAKSLGRYAPTPHDARPWLRRCLGEGGEVGYHAALQLATIAPDTPGVLDRLLEAMQNDWLASNDRHSHDGSMGADAAAEAVTGLLARHPQPMPAEFFERAVRGYRGCRASCAVELWQSHSGRSIVDFPPTDADVIARRAHDWFDMWADLPADVVARRGVLLTIFRLNPSVAAEQLRAVGYGPLAERCGFALPSEVVLPAVAELVRSDGRYAAEAPLGYHLSQLPARPDDWTDEDGWVASLCGRAFDDFTWAVYADWLDDRGHADRAFQVRLLHAHAADPANAPTTSDDDPGVHWVPVFVHLAGAAPLELPE
jgi:uncharacterized protein (TIGR02996 family)